MGGKLSPVIIVVLVLVVIAIGMLIFSLLTSDNDTPSTNQSGSNQSGTSEEIIDEKPILNLSKDFEGEYPNQVIIKVEAVANEENPVEKIILPDGTTIEGTTAEYIVEENGNYEFITKEQSKYQSKIFFDYPILRLKGCGAEVHFEEVDSCDDVKYNIINSMAWIGRKDN